MRRFLRVPFSEAILGGIVAGLSEVGNFLLFDRSESGSLLSILVAVMGLLLSVQRFNIEESRAADLSPLANLADYVDIQAGAGMSGLRALNDRFVAITEVEFRPLKDQIVAQAQEDLRRLAVDKRSTTLLTTQYYEWLFKQFEQARPGEYVHAVSLSSDEEWNDSQLEKNFLEVNRRAAQRGVGVVRIFIVADARRRAFLAKPQIREHMPGSPSHLVGFIVAREELEKQDMRTLKSVAEGFIDFNGRVGLEDIFDSDGEVRGQVTMLSEDLERMRSIFLRLKNMAAPLQ